MIINLFLHVHRRRDHVKNKVKHKARPSVSIVSASSHTRLAAPEVVDRGLAESVLKPSIGGGTFKKDFFCVTQVCPLA